MTRTNSNRIDLTGQRYGRLTVIKEAAQPDYLKGKWVRWLLCKCECGNDKVIRMPSLRNGSTRSCGCLQKDSHYVKHGMSKSSEYRIWNGMVQRCVNPDNARFNDYGGRGLAVCAEWMFDFAKFYKDMGLRPSAKHSIDRIDNDGDYTKENCKWSTPKEQSSNRRVSKIRRPGSATRITGVTLHPIANHYVSKITVSKVIHLLGCYNDFFEACCARKSAEIKLNAGRE